MWRGRWRYLPAVDGVVAAKDAAYLRHARSPAPPTRRRRYGPPSLPGHRRRPRRRSPAPESRCRVRSAGPPGPSRRAALGPNTTGCRGVAPCASPRPCRPSGGYESGFGPMKSDVVLFSEISAKRAFSDEAVARMDRVGTGDRQAASRAGMLRPLSRAPGGPMPHALVGEPHMHGVGVGGRMHGDRQDASSLQARSTRRAISPPIGLKILSLGAPANQTSGSCRTSIRHSMIISGSSNSTGWPSSIRIWITRPARGAGVSVHGLHRLDDQQCVARAHHAADLDIGPCARLRTAIGGTDHQG